LVRAPVGLMADRKSYSSQSSGSARATKRRRLFSLRPSLRSSSPFDLLVWGFILAGMALRLWNLDAMEFKEDEFTHIVGAYRAAVAPWSAPLLVGEGTSVSPGVFFYQFLAVPVSFTRDPVWVARFVAVANIASIPALFLLVRRIFTPRIALWATALFATAPWMIIFSRKIWNPDLVVPFLIVTLWCLFSAMQRYALWKVVAFALSLALVSQLHLSVWLALFPLLPLGLLFRPWRKPIDLAVGSATFVAAHVLTLGPHTDEFLARFTGASAQHPDLGMNLWQLLVYNVGWSVRVPSGFGFEFLLGSGGYSLFEDYSAVPWTRPVFVLFIGLACAGGVYVLVRVVRAASGWFRDVSDRFLLTLILMACSLYGLYLVFRIAAHPHYHIVLSLLPPLLVALFLDLTAERFRKVGADVARALLFVLLAANVAFGLSFLALVRAHPEAIDGNYGRPYFLDRVRWERELGRAFSRTDNELGHEGSPCVLGNRAPLYDPVYGPAGGPSS
jgi:4-amino-4-deoxy-L-arabinose transferase-like glycosyltransferase